MSQKKTPTQPKRRKSPPPIPILVVLLLNLVIIFVATLFVATLFIRYKVSLPCITSSFPISALSLVCLSLIIFHLVWRTIYPVIPKKPKVIINIPVIKIPLSWIINILNSIHLWNLHHILLWGIFAVVSLSAIFVNLTPFSPFYEESQPFVIQGFAVQRSNPPTLEQLSSGDTLQMTTGEKVILEVLLLGESRVSCTWSIATRGGNTVTGCSLPYSARTPGTPDSLSVFVKPQCGSNIENGILNVVVKP
jgi:hypothetical protein